MLGFISEEILHYIWKFQLFNHSGLKTSKNEVISVKKTGTHNYDSGPDFSNAHIKIADKRWVGHVEIHIKSSDWNQHKHSLDRAYDQVILHVVWENDKDIFHPSGELIPCVEIKGRVSRSIFDKYLALKNNDNWIPCASQINEVNTLHVKSMVHRAAIDRLQIKTQELFSQWEASNQDWEETCYRLLCKYLGARVNTIAFEALAKSTPLKVIQKIRHEPLQVDAVLFGQSGLLPTRPSEDYPRHLISEYSFLKSKFDLSPINPAIWKFSRMRPPSFPTVRISQLASILKKYNGLFSKLLDASEINEYVELFAAIPDSYWTTHYRFGTVVEQKSASLGKSTIDVLLINCVVPMLFMYGHQMAEPYFKEKAMTLLEKIKAEKNSIIKQWNNLGIDSSTALDSQGLLQMKRSYCEKSRCLECGIGNQILKMSNARS